jgi:hypothetical protein
LDVNHEEPRFSPRLHPVYDDSGALQCGNRSSHIRLSNEQHPRGAQELLQLLQADEENRASEFRDERAFIENGIDEDFFLRPRYVIAESESRQNVIQVMSVNDKKNNNLIGWCNANPMTTGFEIFSSGKEFILVFKLLLYSVKKKKKNHAKLFFVLDV